MHCLIIIIFWKRAKIQAKNITVEKTADVIRRYAVGEHNPGVLYQILKIVGLIASVLMLVSTCVCYRLRRKLCERRRDRERGHHQEHDVLHLPVQSEYNTYNNTYNSV